MPLITSKKQDNMDLDKGGVKHDDLKIRWDLGPWDALNELMYVWTVGAYKYEPRNWEKGFRWGRSFAAIFRHAIAWWLGEERDPDTGAHHLAQVAWNALALLHFVLNPKKYKKWDDRIGASEAKNPEEWLKKYIELVSNKYEEKSRNDTRHIQ